MKTTKKREREREKKGSETARTRGFPFRENYVGGEIRIINK